MTIDDHLAQGYDAYQHGKTGPWTRALFASELKSDDTLRAEALTKLSGLQAVLAAGRRCHITEVQSRILQDGLRSAA